jgi:hypothetical protein
VPRNVATQVIDTGIKNSKENRLRWASENGPRESSVVILTDLLIYRQIGMDAQDRLVSIGGVPISGLDSTIEAMEKIKAEFEAGTLETTTAIYARDRLDQLIRVTFKLIDN